MELSLSTSAKRVEAALQQLGFTIEVKELPSSTRTAVEAAQAIGCQVAQIVKTIVFRTELSDSALVVLASGVNRVDINLVSAWLGEVITKADADFVRQRTGYVIGGVPPVGFLHPLPTIIDQDLLQYKCAWAAAGTPHAVFMLHPKDLARMTGGVVIQIC
jgi:prolyl-tRNA editing enzyme YbaK/EbsC (Cys-tRNA(Pro) deacylase)